VAPFTMESRQEDNPPVAITMQDTTMSAVPKIEPDRKTVGIWIRVSTEDQAKGESPEHHERRAQA
jgi:hypothetical protein